jgi:hypothetical protein
MVIIPNVPFVETLAFVEDMYWFCKVVKCKLQGVS